MTWLEILNSTIQVGEDFTIPQVARVLAPMVSWDMAGLRTKVYDTILKASKYGMYQRLGPDAEGVVHWRRLA